MRGHQPGCGRHPEIAAAQYTLLSSISARDAEIATVPLLFWYLNPLF